MDCWLPFQRKQNRPGGRQQIPNKSSEVPSVQPQNAIQRAICRWVGCIEKGEQLRILRRWLMLLEVQTVTENI